MLIRLKMQQWHNAMDMLDHLPVTTTFGIEKGLWRIGRDLKLQVDEQVLRTPKTGRIYINRDRLGRRRRHQASAPGESHANLTGTLRKSTSWKASGRELRFGYGVGLRPAPAYAKKIEFDLNRPTLQNSIEAEIKNAEQHLGNHIFREFDRNASI